MAEETDKFEIPVTKVQWGLRGAQAFFALIAIFTISAVIGWDNKYFSASLFSVFFLFIMFLSIFFAAAIVGIPHFYVTKGKFKDAARALRIPRIEFVLSAIWAVLILIVTFLLTIDAYVIRKCDPGHPDYEEKEFYDDEAFISGLPKLCKTQRAANAFGWFALVAWICSLVLIANDWRKSRRQPKQQGPTTFHNKPSSTSVSSSLEEHGLPDTSSTQQTQEHVPMQTIHSTPYPPPQQPQSPPQQIPPHPTFPQQLQPFGSPPSGPISGISIPEPQFPGPGQGQGQGQGQGGISFPQPRYS